jgi:hypothetical protein
MSFLPQHPRPDYARPLATGARHIEEIGCATLQAVIPLRIERQANNYNLIREKKALG